MISIPGGAHREALFARPPSAFRPVRGRPRGYGRRPGRAPLPAAPSHRLRVFAGLPGLEIQRAAWIQGGAAGARALPGLAEPAGVVVDHGRAGTVDGDADHVTLG